jgi:hypothetical protein
MVFHLAPIIAIAKIGEFLSGASLSARFFMARPLRIEFPGAAYKVTSRGNEKIEEAVERYVYTQREVADHLGVHFSPISRIMHQRKGDANKIDLPPGRTPGRECVPIN